MTRRFNVASLIPAVAMAFFFIAGCDQMDQIDKGVAARPAGQGIGLLPDLDEKTTGQPKAQPVQQPNTTPAAATAPGNEHLQKAEDVVTKPRDYGGGALMSPITTPVSEYFSMRGRIPLLQIKHDIDIYHAMNNRYPKDIKEFKSAILDPANIDLPELPPGAEYVYDAKTGELLVRDSGNRTPQQ